SDLYAQVMHPDSTAGRLIAAYSGDFSILERHQQLELDFD
ncbi:MAG: hypothetical protein RLZZ283_765, partial [Candidatus Parcubacteria bacterium]